ncbi:MAG TPA: hypothetical protein VHI71_11345 [Actinomycetota bacterium]|nr:hypothetical protein [Actinomycetota bacterium]
MRKKIALTLAAAALSAGLLPAPASAGQYCERAEEVVVGGGDACRAGLGLVLSVCTKVASKWGNECQLA